MSFIEHTKRTLSCNFLKQKLGVLRNYWRIFSVIFTHSLCKITVHFLTYKAE
ncbi:hypothetical protein BDZ45DRAFT_360353 [Acephala macrosclerotiorum]|nr:hypothetical protein BDZ45DRAFT_360353 [Acephala macrosclerotiorum]